MPAALLEVVYPRDVKTSLPLGEQPALLGRTAPQADVVVAHRTVSRRHLRFVAGDGGHDVEDVGSHNGSRLNGVPMRENHRYRLRAGDVLHVGEVLAVYETEPADQRPAAPLRERRGAILQDLDRLNPLPLSPDAAESLLLQSWTNEQEDLERLARELSPLGRRVEGADLPPWVRGLPEDGSRPRPALPSAAEFAQAHERLAGNVRALARHFQRDRRQIYRWLHAFGLRNPA